MNYRGKRGENYADFQSVEILWRFGEKKNKTNEPKEKADHSCRNELSGVGAGVWKYIWRYKTKETSRKAD